MGSFFVMVHEPRIASHVGCQYCRQPALDPPWPLLHHRPTIQPSYDCTTHKMVCPPASGADADFRYGSFADMAGLPSLSPLSPRERTLDLVSRLSALGQEPTSHSLLRVPQ